MIHKRIAAGLFFASASLLCANSVTLTGYYNGISRSTNVCPASDTCYSQTVVTVGNGQTIQANFSGSGAFSPGTYDSRGNPVPPGSYLLRASLSTYQSDPAVDPGLAPDPDIFLHAVFDIPVDSASWEVHGIFAENGGAYHFAEDHISIYATSGGQVIPGGCVLNEDTRSYCAVFAHAPGMSEQINFDTEASANWGTDQITFGAVLTPTPEPPSIYLLMATAVILAVRKTCATVYRRKELRG